MPKVYRGFESPSLRMADVVFENQLAKQHFSAGISHITHINYEEMSGDGINWAYISNLAY